MASDIRRMSHEEISEINRRAKEWRSRQAKPVQDQELETHEQMDLWSEGKDKS
jgi:hypothetical protein